MTRLGKIRTQKMCVCTYTSRYKTGTSSLSSARLSNVQRRASLSAGFLRCRFYACVRIYSVVFCDKRATQLCARALSPERAANLPVNGDDCEWTRVPTGSTPLNINPLFSRREREREKKMSFQRARRDSQKLFQLKYSLSETIDGIQYRSARSH